MRWCNNDSGVADDRSASTLAASSIGNKSQANMTSCPSCGHRIQCEDQILQELPGLPVGVKFDPSDMEILEHLELKTKPNAQDLLHPLIDTFIPTIEGDDGICYTHPEKLPGVGKDGLVRHFFHRPSKAYTTGTRKRRKILRTDVEDRGETRWHKTGKTRPVFARGSLKGHKKILVLYANCGRHRKPEKTNWVMHQYHLGSDEDEKNGELVVSKVFYQTQPRQNGVSALAARADEAVAPAVQYKGLTVHSRHDSASRNPYNNMLLGGHVDGGATASSPLLPSLSCVPLGHRFFVE